MFNIHAYIHLTCNKLDNIQLDCHYYKINPFRLKQDLFTLARFALLQTADQLLISFLQKRSSVH